MPGKPYVMSVEFTFTGCEEENKEILREYIESYDEIAKLFCFVLALTHLQSLDFIGEYVTPLPFLYFDLAANNTIKDMVLTNSDLDSILEFTKWNGFERERVKKFYYAYVSLVVK